MSVFHGDWNEDPEEFFNLYCQCTATGGNIFKAQQFINYLGAGSEADEWYDELPQEDKKDWAAIEFSFRKKWLKEEVSSINRTVTSENEPQLSATSPTFVENDVGALLAPTVAVRTQTNVLSIMAPLTTSISNQTEIMTSQDLKTGPPNCLAMSQSAALPSNGTGMKMDSTSDFSSNIAVFSLKTPSVASTDSITPYTVISTPETRLTMTIFVQKVEKVENSTFSAQTTSIHLSPSIVGPTSHVTRDYSCPLNPYNVILQLPAASTTTRSSPTPYLTGHEKGPLLGIFFESQSYTVVLESTAPFTAATALETRSMTAGFTQKLEKGEKSCFSQADYLTTPTLDETASTTPSALMKVVTTLKSHLAYAGFIEKHQNGKKSPIFAQNAPKPIISGNPNCANDIYTPLPPTTIVLHLKTRSASTTFAENFQKSPIFAPKAPELVVTGLYNSANNIYSTSAPKKSCRSP